MIDVGERWTGKTATLLQSSLRLSNAAFAARLGIGTRTVATWHAFPARVPNSEMQEVLSVALQRASEDAKLRFLAAISAVASPSPTRGLPAERVEGSHRLQVAIALVVDDGRVLLVKRRGIGEQPDAWQFPAGMVKPGLDSFTVAGRETLAETGIHADARELIGSRVHPDTGVYCEYVLCSYLHGVPNNLDESENVAVTWAPIERLTSFIEQSRIYPAILDALGLSGTSS